MQITVNFFATFKVLSGVDELKIDILEGSSVNELLETLGTEFGNIRLDLPNSLIIVNKTRSSRERILQDGDIVMLLHFLGGG